MLAYFAQGKTLRADISLLFLARIRVEFAGRRGGSHVIILIEPRAIRMTNGTLLEQACNLTAGTEGRG